MPNEILNKRKQQLIKLKKYFLSDLKELEVQSIMIFGSSTNPILFDENNKRNYLLVYSILKEEYFNN